MARTRKKVGEILLNWGLINANALADALQYATEHGKRIGESLARIPAFAQGVLAGVCMWALLLLSPGAKPFIYFRF